MHVDLTVHGPDGTREMRVGAATPATLSELEPLLTPLIGSPGHLMSRRWAVHPSSRLGSPGLRHGCELDWTTEPSRGTERPRAALRRVLVQGGIDGGLCCSLDGRPVSLGRAAGNVLQLRDPQVSRRHAVIALTPPGVIAHDLGSTGGTTLDGRRVRDEPVPMASGQLLRVGDSFLSIGVAPDPVAAARAGPDGTLSVSRVPRSPTPRAHPLPDRDHPGDHHRAIAWLPALIPAVLGAGMAWLTHSLTFLLFAVLTPLGMLGASIGERLAGRRHARRHQGERRALTARLSRALTAEQASRRDELPGPGSLADIATGPTRRLWERQAGDDDLLAVRLGLADLESRLAIDRTGRLTPAGIVTAVPYAVDLAGGSLGLIGPVDVTRGVGRWIIAQLCTLVSPADLELALLVDRDTAPAWQWMRWLPHLRTRIADDPSSAATLAAELEQMIGGRRRSDVTAARVLLVIDASPDLVGASGLPAVLSRGDTSAISAVCVADTAAALVPACTQTAVATGVAGSRLLVVAPGSEQVEIVADQVSVAWADRLARGLAPCVDAAFDPKAGLPNEVRLLDLIDAAEPADSADLADAPDPVGPLTPAAMQARWRSRGARPATPIGVDGDGPIVLDLQRDGPHALLAGTTGAGKSELLISLVAGLALACSPADLTFLLIDFKGGAAFAILARLPHTAGVVTDLDPHLAGRALTALHSELHRRERLCANAGVPDFDAYRSSPRDEPLARLVVVVDEFAALADQLPSFVSGLIAVAQRGRSLGLHLVLATQRPGGAVGADIRANTGVRVALRMASPAESLEVIDASDAAAIARDRPGRAILQCGPTTTPFQSARVAGPRPARQASPWAVPLDRWRRPLTAAAHPDSDEPSDLTRLVLACRTAATDAQLPPVHRPWLPALPDRIAATDLPAPPRAELIPIGREDRPSEQLQPVRHIDLTAGGTLLVTGAAGTGRTTALRTLAIGAAGRLPPSALHLHVIDAFGGLAGLANLPHHGTVLEAAGGPAAVVRFLSRVDADLRRRHHQLTEWRAASVAEAAAAGRRLVLVLILVDGWDALIESLDDYDAGRTTDLLLTILRRAGTLGYTIAIAGDRATLAPRLTAMAAHRFVLRLNDAADYATAGIRPPAASPPAPPPPGRAVRASDGVEMQIAHAGLDPTRIGQEAAIAACLDRWRGHPTSPGNDAPIRVRTLPISVSRHSLGSCGDERAIALGVGGDAAEPIAIALGDQPRHLLISGPPRSGRTNALHVVLLGWLAHAEPGDVCIAAPRHSPLTELARRLGLTLIAPDAAGDARPPPRTGLLLVDDSEAFRDGPAGETLTAWAAADDGPAVVVAARSDELAVTYRGVAAVVRRARCGVLLCPGPVDGELFGLRLPRTRTSDPSGRGLLIGVDTVSPEAIPIQIALP